ncbi:MAG TPA: hypothetical protein PKM63_15755 [Panacibacter sp.]|nr:hypothetical protein [Panacibacter sp.]HNP45746.1 hypothetical protein [Panacibacter sp.]
MNHYDVYIGEFLSRNKAISLGKIGHLSYFSEADAGQHVLTGSLHFTYDKKAVTSPELIDYIAEQTGKKRTLIDSDVDSYFELARQIINIGNPHEIEGIGVFRINKTGQIEFSIPEPGLKKEEARSSKKQQSLSGTSFQPEKRKSKNALMVFAAVIVLAVLVVIGWGTYKLFIGNSALLKDTDTAEEVTILPHKDTTITPVKDSAISSQQTPVVNSNDSAYYRFIHETTKYALRAQKRTETLRSYGNPAAYDSLQTDSGKIYRLYLKIKILPVDSTRVKDSLQKNFQRTVAIEKAD